MASTCYTLGFKDLKAIKQRRSAPEATPPHIVKARPSRRQRPMPSQCKARPWKPAPSSKVTVALKSACAALGQVARVGFRDLFGSRDAL